MLFNLIIRFKNVINFNILLTYWILTYYHIASATELRIREDTKLFVSLYFTFLFFEKFQIYCYKINVTYLYQYIYFVYDLILQVRLNIKINSVEYSKIFAHAIGFRANFDLRKAKKPKQMQFYNGMSAHFHPEQIRKVTEYLFDS